MISVIMANYCGAAFLDAAISSVLRQTHTDLELIVADDASTDQSVALVRRWMARDDRVTLLEAQSNAGAAAARNRCLDAAHGDWIAIADSDDVMHPDRLRRLLAAAQVSDMPIVCDDMPFISDSPDAAGRTLLQPLALREAHEITADALVASDVPDSDQPPFGYLKPLIARSAIGALRYDETMPISEDFDFYLRLFAQGHRAIALPDPMYLYRRHANSLSYRLSVHAVERMLAAHHRIAETAEPALARVFARREAALRRQLGFERLVVALKERRLPGAVAELSRRPGLTRELLRSVAERRARQRAETPARTPLRLSLGAAPHDPHDAHVGFPAPPDAGGRWPEAPAPLAARLTDLAARHDLEVTATGPEGLWALWLMPGWQSATLHLDQTRDTLPLPVPDGVTVVEAAPAARAG